MKKSKLQDMSLKEASDFWDTHDFSEFDDVKEEKGLRFQIARKKYVGLEERLYKKIELQAKKLHTTADHLVSTWLRQKFAHKTL